MQKQAVILVTGIKERHSTQAPCMLEVWTGSEVGETKLWSMQYEVEYTYQGEGATGWRSDMYRLESMLSALGYMVLGEVLVGRQAWVKQKGIFCGTQGRITSFNGTHYGVELPLAGSFTNCAYLFEELQVLGGVDMGASGQALVGLVVEWRTGLSAKRVGVVVQWLDDSYWIAPGCTDLAEAQRMPLERCVRLQRGDFKLLKVNGV